MSMLPRLVLPAVATLGVMYPASFLVGMWQSAESGDLEAPGAWITGGELTSSWRYDVYERHFPKTYRMEFTKADADYGSLCMIEVRNGPKPVTASAGPGTLFYVTLDKPLPGYATTRVSIDLTEALRARCAGVISDGQLFAGGAAGPINAAAMTGARTREARIETARPVGLTATDASLDGALTPVSLEPTSAAMGM